jgi:tRNA nucleotidyltransferase (CCA-adding enzyme)
MPDYNFLMDSRLRPAQARVVSQMGRLAATQGLNLYLAGGAVRDLTLGLEPPRGLEFVVEGNIQKLIRPLTNGIKEKPRPAGAVPEEPIDLKVQRLDLDAARNRAEVIFEGGVPGEIAGARNETYTSPSRPPATAPGTIFDDLRRRDFSANAMAISLHPFSRGLLLDPTNGAADLERKELRALHSRSFFDDPSRIYRLIRLCIRLDFKPDEKTARWLDAALAENVWQELREDQQGRELRAILEEDLCVKVLKALRDRDLLGGLDRKLASARVDFDRFERVRNGLRIAGESNVLFPNFLTLVEKFSSGERARLAKKVFGDPRTIKTVLGLENEAAKIGRLLGSAKAAKASQVHAILSAAPSPLPVLLLVQNQQAAVQNRVKAFYTKFPAIRAAAPRAELEALGMPAGPKFEQILEQVFLEQLDGKLKTPPQITKALRTYSGIKEPPPAPPAPPARTSAKSHAGKDSRFPRPATPLPSTPQVGPMKPAAALGKPRAVLAASAPAARPVSAPASKPAVTVAPPRPPAAAPGAVKLATAAPAKSAKGPAGIQPAKKSESAPPVKSAVRPAVKSAVKLAVKSAVRPAVKLAVKPAVRPAVKAVVNAVRPPKPAPAPKSPNKTTKGSKRR